MEEKKDVVVEHEVEHEEEVIEEETHVQKKERKNKHKEQVEKLENEVKSYKDKLLRNAAELENFKKRMIQERIIDRKYASKNLVGDILIPLEQMKRLKV